MPNTLEEEKMKELSEKFRVLNKKWWRKRLKANGYFPHFWCSLEGGELEKEIKKSLTSAHNSALDKAIKIVDKNIDDYKEIGKSLQGQSELINREKIHMAYVIRADLINNLNKRKK